MCVIIINAIAITSSPSTNSNNKLCSCYIREISKHVNHAIKPFSLHQMVRTTTPTTFSETYPTTWDCKSSEERVKRMEMRYPTIRGVILKEALLRGLRWWRMWVHSARGMLLLLMFTLLFTQNVSFTTNWYLRHQLYNTKQLLYHLNATNKQTNKQTNSYSE